MDMLSSELHCVCTSHIRWLRQFADPYASQALVSEVGSQILGWFDETPQSPQRHSTDSQRCSSLDSVAISMYVPHKRLLLIFGLISIDFCSAEPAEGICVNAVWHQVCAPTQTFQLHAFRLILLGSQRCAARRSCRTEQSCACLGQTKRCALPEFEV